MKGILKLGLYSFLLFLFFAYVGPFMISLSPTWQGLNRELEEHGVEGGALFYTEIPFIEDAEKHIRASVKKGMEIREEKKQAEENNTADNS